MPLDYPQVDKHLEDFTKVFVFFFEEALTTYHRNLVDQVSKPGKWADFFSCIIRIITTGTLLSATGATVGAPVGAIIGAPTISSLLLPLASLAMSDLGIHYHRKKLIRIINLLVIYQQDKENKMKVRENLIAAGIKLFKSFEIKFGQVTCYTNHELALLKLAHDAVDRIFNFFDENSSELEESDFLTASNITKAVILGKSKRYRNIYSIPNRHLGYPLDHGLTTKRLYQETPVLKLTTTNENYCYKKNNSRDISDFRLVFEWEEAVDPPIQWEDDDKIVLFGNRSYQKINSIPETTLNGLTLIHLSEEELEEKKQKILVDLSSQYQDVLGEAFKQELEAITEYMRNEFKDEANKFKKNITDLNSVIIATMESLTKLKEGQEDIKQQVKYLQEKKFPSGEEKKEEIIATSLSAILNRVKKYLDTIEAANDQGFYTPLDAHYDPATPNNSDRFSLLDKVIAFIENPQRKKLLLLGEAGSGKTSFLIHLTQFLLKNPFFSTQNQHILAFYIRSSRIKSKNLNMVTIEYLLQDYYHFNSQEIGLLFENHQQVYCFIFDDMDELDPALNRVLIEDIYNKFPSSHCIFTAYPHSLKLGQIPVDLFVSLSKEKEEEIIYVAPFNAFAKKDYIAKFKGKNLPFELAGEDEETIYQRIQAIPSLDNIIDKPIFLRMVMEVLVPLEKIYQQEKIIPESEYVRKDLFHIYTHTLTTRMAEKFKNDKGIKRIAALNMYDCILIYSVNLAKLMKETNILEIDENALNDSTRDQSNLILTHKQLNAYKKCFTKRYNPQLFKDSDDYKQHKYGYQGCLFVHTYGTPGNRSYAFSHKEFLNYFCTFDDAIPRRKKIQALIDSTHARNPVEWSRQSSVKESVSLRSECSFEQEECYLRLRRFSDQEGSYIQSRRSSITSAKEERTTARLRHTSDQTSKVSFLTGGGRSKASYLSHVSGHNTPATEYAAESTIDPVADSVLNVM